jgi:hypothetical protein
VFAKYQEQNYPYRFHGTLHVDSIAGGVPMDPNIYQGHLKRKLIPGGNDAALADEVLSMIAENGMSREEAIAAYAGKSLVGFRRDPEHGLWYPGAHLKAAIKEAASIAAAEGRIKARGWGQTSHNKGILSWLSEHIFVIEDRLYLGVDHDDPSVRIEQSFVHKITPRGPISAVQNTEIVEDCDIRFTIEADHDLPEADWAAIWLTAERNGIGAARKMGYGTFEVTEWEAAND